MKKTARAKPPKTLTHYGSPAIQNLDIWGLPRGKHSIAPGDIARSQRARLLYAMTVAVGEKGYAATTITDVVHIAKLSRTTFYQQFRDKESCMIAAYEAAQFGLVRAVIDSQTPGSGWNERLRASTRAYLRYERDYPEMTRAMLIEINAAGLRAWEHREAGYERFARMQRALYEIRRQEQPGLPELPDEIFIGMTAAIEEMVRSYIRAGKLHRVMELERPMLYMMEALYSGAAQAVKVLKEPKL